MKTWFRNCSFPAVTVVAASTTEDKRGCLQDNSPTPLRLMFIAFAASTPQLMQTNKRFKLDNILVLDVFFEALNYETIEQKKAYEVAGLLGDIGGQMGLFIGASILTILELFDYAYEVVKERLMDLLSREEEEESHAEEVSSCDPVANHSESISHTVAVPLQTCTLEEIAC
ncbi:hypothetical protein WMY93_002317 [Mugilogobius chulae]|uniref:Acid-sensing ion channel 2 n=1 Tax=Mugilogobius chulae TaxID=88201 RepID=A0AAW0Q8E3_9GOBI